VGVAFAYLGLATNVLQSFFDWLGQFEEAMTGLERMNEYLRLPLEPGARLPIQATFDTGDTGHARNEPDSGVVSKNWDGLGAPVEIHELWMRYRSDLPMVLHGINLKIHSGERLAIVGRTGSGKTSLVQALFHLYPLERGEIRIGGLTAALKDGEARDRVELDAYRRLLSYITQEPTLLIGSLRENLCSDFKTAKAPKTPKMGDDELIRALRRVQFLRDDATDSEYRHWLDYHVEERGRNLSAGERQLVCMARCLLRDSPVVILDEATSAVDPRSEEILTRATEEFFLGKTQIVIAHRLSTIQSCQRVLWLQDGKIHRLGPPDEVLREFESAELNA
jgi:ABC-type multidrug transport system fused ATPase/permease subunit